MRFDGNPQIMKRYRMAVVFEAWVKLKPKELKRRLIAYFNESKKHAISTLRWALAETIIDYWYNKANYRAHHKYWLESYRIFRKCLIVVLDDKSRVVPEIA